MAIGNNMRTFKMIRFADESGVSGTGHVLDGVIFGNGKVAVSWISKWISVSVYDDFDTFWFIHCESHPTNRTEIHFDDGEIVKELISNS